MRIAMLIPSLAQTGPGIVARDLCEELMAMGHFCEIFYLDNKFGLKTPCKTVRISKGEELNPNDWDIIHSHGFRPDKFCHNLIRCSDSTRSKFISTLHQPISIKELRKSFSSWKSIVGSLLWKKYLNDHNSVVVLNNETLNSLPNKIKNKARIINNGRTIKINDIEDDDKKRLNKLKDKYLIIGSHSVITRRKGLDQMIRALPLLPGYAFVIIGEGDERKRLEKLSNQLKVSDRCIFLGYKPNSVDYLRFFDIFVMCTRSEGFPLALIEAASQGISTVLSDIPILKSIMDEDKVTFYHLDNIESLANAICDATKKNKGKELKKYYSTSLTAEAMAKSYLSLYQDLLKN